MTPTIDSLFTLQSLGTLAGGTIACWVVPNVIGQVTPLTDVWRKRIALALAVALAVALASQAAGGWDKWLVAVFNGFLVASASFGVNEVSVGNPPPPAGTQPTPAPNSDTFSASWR